MALGGTPLIQVCVDAVCLVLLTATLPGGDSPGLSGRPRWSHPFTIKAPRGPYSAEWRAQDIAVALRAEWLGVPHSRKKYSLVALMYASRSLAAGVKTPIFARRG